jgi:exodeoxyribonuclease-5
LYGAAGTGKTYLLKEFIDKHVKMALAVTAPTHKALRVAEKSTGRKGKTFQSLHGLRPDFDLEDFNIDNVKFNTIGDETIRNYKFVVVDECSMISKSLHDLNASRAGTYDVKILYVGDILQLPPVKKSKDINSRADTTSPVFNLKNKFELLELVRQKSDSPLIELLGILRTDIINSTSEFLKYLEHKKVNLNDKKEGYACLNMKQFSKVLLNKFSEGNHLHDVNYIKYAAWTNANINLWNTFTRNVIIPDRSVLISNNDILLGYKSILDPMNLISNIITNSIDYKVLNVETRQSDEGFNVYGVEITDGIKNSIISIVDHKSRSFSKFYNIISNLHYNAVYANAQHRSRRWSEYYEFKNRFLVIKPIPIRDGNQLRGTVPKDIDYGYGMTIHKLQGSTIKNMFVNILDIIYNKGDKNFPIYDTVSNPYAIQYRNKLVYTAISRASERAIMLF